LFYFRQNGRRSALASVSKYRTGRASANNAARGFLDVFGERNVSHTLCFLPFPN
jgi:hypothetical protein